MASPYIHESDLPALPKRLSFVETCQSASRLVEVRPVPFVRCPCRHADCKWNWKENQRELSAHTECRTIDIDMERFECRFFPYGLERALIVRGAAGLCPSCLTLYYWHEK